MKLLFVLRFGFCFLAAGAVVHAQVYLMPRTVTRARLHAEAVHRGDAIRRQRALQAARMTNNVATNATPATAVSNANTAANNNNIVPNSLPLNYSSFAPQRLTVRTNTPRTNITQTAKIDLPRTLPISETSGPEFNDRDPLLGYQREQAEKGNPESQYAMGVRYLNGTGVDQSDVLARQWFEKASLGGNLKARAKLHEMDNAK